MADFGVFPCLGEAGHGVHRSSIEVHRLRRRVRVHGRRTAILQRQAVQERPQALQAVQGEARHRRPQGSFRDPDYLFGVRHRDHGSVQAHPGQAGAMPFLFPETAGQASNGDGAYRNAELRSRSPLNPGGKPATLASEASCAQLRGQWKGAWAATLRLPELRRFMVPGKKLFLRDGRRHDFLLRARWAMSRR